MVTAKTCCCCMTLRTGTYMAAVFSLLCEKCGASANWPRVRRRNLPQYPAMRHFRNKILGALGVVECALLWLGLTVEEEERGTYSGDRYENDMVAMSITILKITIYVSMGLYGAWALFAIFAICGVNCGKRCMLIPWMVFTGIVTGLCIWGIISNAKTLRDKFQDPHQAAVLGIQMAVVIINMYSVCVVSSFYRNDLKEYDDEFSSVPTMVPAGVDEEYPYKE